MNEETVSTPEVPQKDPKALRKADRRFLSRLLGRYFVICCLFLLLQTLIPFAALELMDYDFFMAHYLVICMLPSYIIILPVAWRLMRKFPKERLPERSMLLITVLGAFLVCFAALYLGSLVGSGVNAVYTHVTGNETLDSLEEILESTDIWENFLITVVLAPLVEELLFRKFLIDRLSRFGGGFAIVISALMFGLYHGNITQLLYAFPAGLVLGWVYCVTGQYIYSVMIHTLVNFVGSILPMLVMESTETAMVLYSGFILLMLGGGIVLFFITRKNALSMVPKAERKAGAAIWNVGSILYLLLCLSMIAWNTLSGVV